MEGFLKNHRQQERMALNLVGDFFGFVNVQLFDAATVLLIVSFLVWELPRSIKLLGEEYTKGLYPEGGRVPDFLILIIALACVGFFHLGSNAQKTVTFIKTPGVTALYLILLVSVPLIITLGFLKRFFARMDKHESVTIFLVHGFLDLFHTAFFIAAAALLIPALGFLIGLH
jgi:hypothetical protein